MKVSAIVWFFFAVATHSVMAYDVISAFDDKKSLLFNYFLLVL
jgi:hypothetical protein